MQVIKPDIKSYTVLSPGGWTVGKVNDVNNPIWGGYVWLSAAEAEALRLKYDASLKALLMARISIEVPDDTPENRRNGFTIKPLDSNNSIIKPTLSLYQERVPFKNANFYARRDAGEIVVSPYLRGRITVTSFPAVLERNPVFNGSFSFTLDELPGVTKYERRFWLTDTLFAINVEHPTFNYIKVDVAYLPPLAVTARDVFDQMVSNSIDTGLVARQLADMNKGTLDVLTAMAEMPKLISSVFNGLSLVGKMRKAALKKEISISAAHDRRKDFLKKRFDREIYMLNQRKMVRKPGQKVLSNRAFVRQKERIRKSYHTALKSAAVEFTDAVASIWMNFRYNIMPTVYLINDIEDTLAFKRTFLTRRNGYSKVYQLNLGGEQHSYTVNHRIFIKRKIYATGSLNSASANFAVTAWELIPLSWVIDWFVNIGDMMAAFSVSSSFYEQGSTWAERKVIDSDVTNPDGQRVTVSGFIYNRQVIDPIQLTCIDFKYDMNADRYKDSFALLWNGIRSNLANKRN